MNIAVDKAGQNCSACQIDHFGAEAALWKLIPVSISMNDLVPADSNGSITRFFPSMDIKFPLYKI